jgi:superfamily I DNA/RNA helicase
MNLTSEQHDAITCDSSMTVIASAGTGKTTVLTERFAHCLKNGVPSFRILAFTFTEKATRLNERTDFKKIHHRPRKHAAP